jgi:hypothetical protein
MVQPPFNVVVDARLSVGANVVPTDLRAKTEIAITDPISLDLPPGWTFTFDSDASSDVPEPSSRFLLGVGIASLSALA